MKSQAAIIQATIRSPYMQSMISKNGWSEQDAAYKVVGFLTCGQQISLHDFMESATVATATEQ